MPTNDTLATAIAALDPLIDDSALQTAAQRIAQGVDAFTVLKLLRDTYEGWRNRDEAERALQHADSAAAPQPVGEWQPVPDGDLVPTITDGEMWAYARDGKLGKAIVIRKDHFHGDIILADGYAVCRRGEQHP